MKDQKLCKDCKHCEVRDDLPPHLAMKFGDYRCKRNAKHSVVHGGLKDIPSCNYERDSDFIETFVFNLCGKSGRYWEAK